nr:unknown [Candidatus Phytoplasma luffae]
MLTNQEFININQLNTNSKSVQIIKLIFNKATLNLTIDKYMKSNHIQLNHYFETNNFCSQSQKSIRGKINEYLILLYLNHKGIKCLYPKSYLFFIPDIKFDLVLFTQTKRIIAFNFKTCLRERYKQAIIEAQQLKKLDTRFEYYLLTNDEVETQKLNNKIKNGKVQSINKVINLFSDNANLF